MNCQENNPRPTAGYLQLIRCLDPIQDRHRNIADNNIGLEFHGRIKQGLAVPHRVDNFKCRCQDSSHNLQHLGRIVCEEHSCSNHLAHYLPSPIQIKGGVDPAYCQYLQPTGEEASLETASNPRSLSGIEKFGDYLEPRANSQNWGRLITIRTVKI